MALRLQSNLLYVCLKPTRHRIFVCEFKIIDLDMHRFGVSSVYTQQCSYLLLDVQSLLTLMRQMLRSVQSMGNELDPNAGRVR